jgi:putative transposase
MPISEAGPTAYAVFPVNESNMKHMAGRKRHSAEDIVRKLRRADELAAEGKTGEEIAPELGVSAAMLCNWRRGYGGMDTDAARTGGLSNGDAT